jgi:hypothetical protein
VKYLNDTNKRKHQNLISQKISQRIYESMPPHKGNHQIILKEKNNQKKSLQNFKWGPFKFYKKLGGVVGAQQTRRGFPRVTSMHSGSKIQSVKKKIHRDGKGSLDLLRSQRCYMGAQRKHVGGIPTNF